MNRTKYKGWDVRWLTGDGKNVGKQSEREEGSKQKKKREKKESKRGVSEVQGEGTRGSTVASVVRHRLGTTDEVGVRCQICDVVVPRSWPRLQGFGWS